MSEDIDYLDPSNLSAQCELCDKIISLFDFKLADVKSDPSQDSPDLPDMVLCQKCYKKLSKLGQAIPS